MTVFHTAPQKLQPATSAERGQRRAAFTLLEVLLAITLTSLLMAAIYTAMSVYWTTASESFDEIERTQIARALLRDMARDIQSVTFAEQEMTESEQDSDSDADDELPDADTALASYTNGLFGTNDDLVLYVSRPDPNQSYISAQELVAPSDRSSDAMIVRYLLAVDGGNGLSGEMAGQSTVEVGSSAVKGLARMSGDLSGLSTAINLGDLEMQLAATSMLAPEVELIEFRYFDGVEEQTEWDSTVQNAMPLSVIIEMTLRTLPNPNQSVTDKRTQEQMPGYQPPTRHRLVVPIPVSKPYVGETAI